MSPNTHKLSDISFHTGLLRKLSKKSPSVKQSVSGG